MVYVVFVGVIGCQYLVQGVEFVLQVGEEVGVVVDVGVGVEWVGYFQVVCGMWYQLYQVLGVDL